MPPGTPGVPAGCCVCGVRSCPGLWRCTCAGPSVITGELLLCAPLSALTWCSPLEPRHLRLSFLREHDALGTRSGCSFLVPHVRVCQPRRSAEASPAGATTPFCSDCPSCTLTSLIIQSLPGPPRWSLGSCAGFHVGVSPHPLGPGPTRATAGPSCEWMFCFLAQTGCFPEGLTLCTPAAVCSGVSVHTFASV